MLASFAGTALKAAAARLPASSSQFSFGQNDSPPPPPPTKYSDAIFKHGLSFAAATAAAAFIVSPSGLSKSMIRGALKAPPSLAAVAAVPFMAFSTTNQEATLCARPKKLPPPSPTQGTLMSFAQPGVKVGLTAAATAMRPRSSGVQASVAASAPTVAASAIPTIDQAATKASLQGIWRVISHPNSGNQFISQEMLQVINSKKQVFGPIMRQRHQSGELVGAPVEVHRRCVNFPKCYERINLKLKESTEPEVIPCIDCFLSSDDAREVTGNKPSDFYDAYMSHVTPKGWKKHSLERNCAGFGEFRCISNPRPSEAEGQFCMECVIRQRCSLERFHHEKAERERIAQEKKATKKDEAKEELQRLVSGFPGAASNTDEVTKKRAAKLSQSELKEDEITRHVEKEFVKSDIK